MAIQRSAAGTVFVRQALLAPASPGSCGSKARARYRAQVAAACAHIDSAEVLVLPEPLLGCEECLKTGDRWQHLRMCMSCGKVGCCDSSPNRHASRHYREEGHPLMRSAERGENWAWCFVDEVTLMLDAEPGS